MVKTAPKPATKTRPPKTGQPTGLNATPDAGGQPTGNGKSVDEMVRKSNLWRDNYNPLRALTIARLTAIFEAAERGAYAELQLTLRKAEKRFPVLKGFIEKLLSSIEELEWDVKVMEQLPEGATAEMAEKQRKFLRSRYDLLKNLTNTFGQLALADIRGYAVLQKHRYSDGVNDGAVEELYWIEPWCFVRDGFYGDFYYNQDSRIGVGLGSCQTILGEQNRLGGEFLPREDFIVREVDSPLYEIALIAMVNWLMARKDYSAFVEIFGLPNSVVIMPPNIAPGKELDYQAAAEKVADGVSGALPNGSDVKFPGAGAAKEAPFEKYCEAQDKDVVLAATGGTLTMIAMPTGLGKGASAEHDEAWQKIAITKARRVNETLQRDFDIPELAAEFPGEPVCVYFELAVKNHEDVNLVADTVVKFEGVGLQTDAAEISERSGYKLTRVALPPPTDPAAKADQHIDSHELNAAVKNRVLKLLNRAGADNAEQFYMAIAADLKPLQDRLAAIEKISDDTLRQQKLSALYADLDQLIQDITADPEAVRVMESITAKGVIAGMKNQPAKNRRKKSKTTKP